MSNNRFRLTVDGPIDLAGTLSEEETKDLLRMLLSLPNALPEQSRKQAEALLRELEADGLALPHETPEQVYRRVEAIMAGLPEGYISGFEIEAHNGRLLGKYSLKLDGYFLLCNQVTASEMITRATRYVEERAGFGGASLPVGVVDGIYD